MVKPSSSLLPLLLSALRIPCFSSSSMASSLMLCSFFSLFLTRWFFLTGPHKLLVVHPSPIFFQHARLPCTSFFVISFPVPTQPSTAQSFLLTGSRGSMGPKLHLSTELPFLSLFGATQSQHSSDTSQCHSTSFRGTFSFQNCLSNKHKKPYLPKTAV